MTDTTHLLSTEANKKRLLESITQDKKTSKKAETRFSGVLNKAGKK